MNGGFWFLFLCPVLTLSQNLVPNGGFEEYIECPNQKHSQINAPDDPNGWFNPFGASFIDYYNKCSDVPEIKVVDPRNGKGCILIDLFFSEPQVEWDYVSFRLETPLKQDQIYCVRFYYKYWKKYSAMAASSIGVLFSNQLIPEAPSQSEIRFNPQIVSPKGWLLDTAWVEVVGVYRANGSERILTIGNFTFPQEWGGVRRPGIMPDSSTAINYVPRAMYFIDDFSMTEITNEFFCAPVNAPILLSNINFQSGGVKLLATSYATLDKLCAYLKSDPLIHIEISGHTDSTGHETSNQKLSAQRAKTVADYLINKGISKKRIHYKGYGSSRPLVPNNNESGRARNRRVEFVLRSGNPHKE